MKRKIGFMKAYLVRMFTGWTSVKYFGYPPIVSHEDPVEYLVTVGDGSIVDLCQYWGKKEWVYSGFAEGTYPKWLRVKAYKKFRTQRFISSIVIKYL